MDPLRVEVCPPQQVWEFHHGTSTLSEETSDIMHPVPERSDRGKAISVECNFCGEPFDAGGRNLDGTRLPNKTQLYCSKRCAGRAKDRRGVCCNDLGQDGNYIAQFFDGEGSAFASENG